MYVVNSTKWENSRLSGQEKLLADTWLEAVGDDGTAACWPPVFSCYQLFCNLLEILDEIGRQGLRPYHLTHAIEELLFRLDEGTWLEDEFPLDLRLMREKLRDAQDRTKDTLDDIRVRNETASFLRAFVRKVEFASPCSTQVRLLSEKVANGATHFGITRRAVHELTNDLRHLGYARAHLSRWMLREVVGSTGPQSYLERFGSGTALATERLRDFEVLFHVAAPRSVRDARTSRFLNSAPNDWAFSPSSPFIRNANNRCALVRVSGIFDCHSAIVFARAALSRYFWSAALDGLDFDRSISKYSASKATDDAYVYEEQEPRVLRSRLLKNAHLVDAIPAGTRNEHTFGAVDRILYWIEQARRADPSAGLISNWTALEFLFTLPGLSDLDAVQAYLPFYLAPAYPRLLLLDFWKFFLHIRPAISTDVATRLEIRSGTHGRERRTCNLVKLLEACLEDGSTNIISPLIADYPVVIAKFHRVRRLKPGTASLIEDVTSFNKKLVFDVRTCYRARNTVVHNAATNVSENERLLQRLSWMLSATLDQVIFQFSRNPTLALTDIHACFRASYLKWYELAAAVAPPFLTLEQTVFPDMYFLR